MYDNGSNVTVGYTYYGDANVDGIVNALDFNAVASHFGALSGKLWYEGDFNYDGRVNSLDFNAVAINFNQVLAAAPAASALGVLVPEPAVFGLMGLIALAWPRRCRRR
jgi:hypothetical protein